MNKTSTRHRHRPKSSATLGRGAFPLVLGLALACGGGGEGDSNPGPKPGSGSRPGHVAGHPDPGSPPALLKVTPSEFKAGQEVILEFDRWDATNELFVDGKKVDLAAEGLPATEASGGVSSEAPVRFKVRIPAEATAAVFTVKSSQGVMPLKVAANVQVRFIPTPDNPVIDPPGSPIADPPPSEFDADGFNAAGIHQVTGALYNPQGYNAAGFNAKGFNAAGIHQSTGTPFDSAGFNAAGFNAAGYNAAGYNEAGYNAAGFNAAGFNAAGFDAMGFNAAGIHQTTGTAYNPAGYNAAGFNAAGFNATGLHQTTGTAYNPAGYNAAGFNAAGFNAAGIHQTTGTVYNPAGYNEAGFNAAGFNAAGNHQTTGTAYNPAGYNEAGFNAAGFNAAGLHQTTGTAYNPAGYNAAGFNPAGFNAAGIHQTTGTDRDPNGFNAAGLHVTTGTAYNPSGYDVDGNNAGGHNRAVLRAFANSQAEALKIGFAIRSGLMAPPTAQWVTHGGANWLDQVVINGVPFDTSSYAHDLEQAFYVHDAALAARLTVALGAAFSVGDPIAQYEMNVSLPSPLKDDIRADVVGMGGADTVTFFHGDQQLFPRMFTLNAVTPQEDAYQVYLVDQVAQRAATLGLPNFHHSAIEFAIVSPTGGRPEAGHMADLLDAVQNENETMFIQSLTNFWNIWGNAQAGAKTAFIEAMCRLYVTKQFPSVATKSIYFHFILRCGQIHT